MVKWIPPSDRPNLRECRLDVLAPLIAQMKARPETIGLCLLGSAALSGERPHIDDWSDVDFALFLNFFFPRDLLSLSVLDFQEAVQKYVPRWIPNFKFPALSDPGRLGRFEVNIHQLVLPYEEQAHIVWPADRREAFCNTCDVIYDPTGRVGQLVACKSKPPARELYVRMLEHLARIPIILSHTVDKCSVRTMYLDAHLALNACLDRILLLMFDLNGRDPAHPKWRVYLAKSLPICPARFSERVSEATEIRSIDDRDIERRRSMVAELYGEIRALCFLHHEIKSDPYSETISRFSAGWQLRYTTTADSLAPDKPTQETRMADESWVLANLNLLE